MVVWLGRKSSRSSRVVMERCGRIPHVMVRIEGLRIVELLPTDEESEIAIVVPVPGTR